MSGRVYRCRAWRLDCGARYGELLVVAGSYDEAAAVAKACGIRRPRPTLPPVAQVLVPARFARGAAVIEVFERR